MGRTRVPGVLRPGNGRRRAAVARACERSALGPATVRRSVAAGRRQGLGAHVGPGARGEGALPAGAPPGSGCTASWIPKTWGGEQAAAAWRSEEPSDPRGRWGSAAPRWLG